MDCSTPGLHVPHRILKFAQVHVHCTGDAIQPSHPQFKGIISWHSAFFTVQLSQPYVTTGKTTALTTRPFVSVHICRPNWILNYCFLRYLAKTLQTNISKFPHPSVVDPLRTKTSLEPPWNVTYQVIVTTSVQFSSVAQSCPTLCDPMNGSMPGFPVQHQLPELAQTHVYPNISSSTTSSSSCPQSFPAPGFFSNESALPIRWPKYWSFSYSISTSNEYSGLISFRID